MIDPQRKGISDDILFQRGLKGEGLALLKSVDINRSSPEGRGDRIVQILLPQQQTGSYSP
ncbi:hypothetical protein ACM2V3_17460, partial [Escherichia coli]